MRALVTGSAGFIGGTLVQELKTNGYEVIGFDKRKAQLQGNIVNFNFDKILKDTDVVFHLAGLLGTTELFHRVIDAEKVNVIGTLNLLESMRRNDVSRIIFTSKPNIWKYNVYTITKENCERYLEMYREIYGIKSVIARPFNVYGPCEYITEYRKAVPYFIVMALRNEPIEIFGYGKQNMDAVYVDDTVKALRICAEKVPKETVEIGTSKPVSVNDLAEKIVKLTSSKSEIVHISMRKGEFNSERLYANGNMERLLGFKPQTSLHDGLKMTIKWYREHLNEMTNIYKFNKEDFL